MEKAEAALDINESSKGLWAVMIEEELRILDYYQPVLGLPDTLKAKLLKPLREQIILNSSNLYSSKLKLFKFDFKAPLDSIKEDYAKNWKPLREEDSIENKDYPVLGDKELDDFRKDVRNQLLERITDEFPSLVNTDKPTPPDDWSTK